MPVAFLEASWDPPSEGYVSLADLVVKEKNTKQQHQNNQRKPPKPPKKGYINIVFNKIRICSDGRSVVRCNHPIPIL